MNQRDIYLLAIIAECETASYSAISLRSRTPDYFLGPQIDDLVNRGFVKIEDSRYRLAKGVKETVLPQLRQRIETGRSS